MKISNFILGSQTECFGFRQLKRSDSKFSRQGSQRLNGNVNSPTGSTGGFPSPPRGNYEKPKKGETLQMRQGPPQLREFTLNSGT